MLAGAGAGSYGGIGGRESGKEILVKETSASPFTVLGMGGCREKRGLSTGVPVTMQSESL